jgi:hypothetical protein
MSATLIFPGESTAREVEFPLLSDDELVDLAYEFVQTFDDLESTALYFIFEEVFERWAPESEWRNTVRRTHDCEFGPEPLRAELEAIREAMQARAVLRLGRLPIREAGAS